MKHLAIFALALSLVSCATVPPPAPQEPVRITVVGTTDVHGYFAGRPERTQGGGEAIRIGGLATLAGYVDALRKETGDNVILVDSGDMFQGTLESNYYEGEPMIRGYNELGYAAAAVGNHEFDYGPVGADSIPRKPGDDPLGALKKNAALAKFPLLSANMIETATGRTPDWARRSTMVAIDGVSVGIIGLSTITTPTVTVPQNVAALTFTEAVPATVAEARALRAAGADAVIVIAHMGGRCQNVQDITAVQSCDDNQEAQQFLNRIPPGTIDAYFGGHTHAQMRQMVNGVAAVQGMPFSQEFSVVDLHVDPRAGRVVRAEMRPLTAICPQVYEGTERCDSRTAPAGARLVARQFAGHPVVRDTAVATVLQPFLEGVAVRKAQPVGVTLANRAARAYQREAALGNLLADGLRLATGADIAFFNSGGIRANMNAGVLTYGDVFEVSPFENFPAVVELTGAEITEMLRVATRGNHGVLQTSGLRYTFDEARDAGKPFTERNRLVSVLLANGEPIDLEKTYRVAMPDFMVVGGDGNETVMGRVPESRKRIDLSRPIRDAVFEALAKLPQPLAPKVEGRITVLNPAQNGER